jgi:HSP20 family molecular chaperone IbpA
MVLLLELIIYPRTVNSQDIKADYKGGVLIVTIPKSEESKGKKIRIE